MTMILGNMYSGLWDGTNGPAKLELALYNALRLPEASRVQITSVTYEVNGSPVLNDPSPPLRHAYHGHLAQTEMVTWVPHENTFCLNNVNFWVFPSATLEECQSLCLEASNCVAITYYENGIRSKCFLEEDCSDLRTSDYGATTYEIRINGLFSEWSEWTECSKECGTGEQSRTRTCDNPEPEMGGADCIGEATETKTCELCSKFHVHKAIECKDFGVGNLPVLVTSKIRQVIKNFPLSINYIF